MVIDKISQSIMSQAIPEYVVMRVPTHICKDADCGYTKQFDWDGNTYQVIDLKTIATPGNRSKQPRFFIQFTGRIVSYEVEP